MAVAAPSVLSSVDTDIYKGGREQTNREAEIVQDCMQEFQQLTTWRNVFAGQWEEAARLIYPEHRNTFFYGSFIWPGQKKTEDQVDSTGMLALHRFSAIVDSLLTPANDMWHGLEADNPDVMKQRNVRLWFTEVTKRLFRLRNNPNANFRGQNNANWRMLGAFGNATMFIDAFDGRLNQGARGFRYKALPLGQTFFRENHQGVVEGLHRWMRMTPYQAVQKFGMARLPVSLRGPLQQNSQWRYNFLHVVRPRDPNEYDPKRLDARGMPYTSYYICLDMPSMVADEGGYRSFPFAVSRYLQGPEEVYGRGPTQMVLPSLKTLNAQKRTFLVQGHRAGNPVLLTGDDGILGMDMRPGAMNKGGVSADGKLMVQVLPTGNIQINEKMMGEERSIIDDMFLVSLFKVLSEHPEMTATQVIELVNEKGMLVAPTLGQQETNLCAMIDRELDLGSFMGFFPPMPPALREARGEYTVKFTNPLAKAQRMSKASGFVRLGETVKEFMNITQDESYGDRLDFDEAIPELGDILDVPENWMADDQKVVQKRRARAKAQQAAQQAQTLPAQAAMITAQAKMAKATPGLGTQGLGGPQQQAPQQ